MDIEILKITCIIYLNRKDTNGFLLKKLEIQEVEASIKQNPIQFYVIIDLTDNLLAYVKLKEKIEANILKDAIWDSESIKKKFLSPDYWVISQIATKKEYQMHGLGRYLLGSLLKAYPHKSFASFVANKPFRNAGSMNFHKCLGFGKVGRFTSPKHFNLNNYESFLFLKETN